MSKSNFLDSKLTKSQLDELNIFSGTVYRVESLREFLDMLIEENRAYGRNSVMGPIRKALEIYPYTLNNNT